MTIKIRSAGTLVARFIERSTASLVDNNLGFSAPNPFLPQKNPITGRWHPPRYSLRRQKELVKQARADGILGLLPPGLKAGREQGAGAGLGAETSASTLPRWEGEPASRSAVGIRSTQRRFKGHKWEREQKERSDFVAKRMETMAKRIADTKAVCRNMISDRQKIDQLDPHQARIQERTKARPSLPF
ncbi:hypothetical protein RhiJN_04253 [Ceratobasidium sp. AG-Ba]|nr:hypothetical protein RhiJN_04253 [Ceratobasidium sp. AG-Ba]QRW05145.1 hypothetical protein RhiLY_04144 [Ceratobasidium sp. AG-Ba]